MIDAFLQSSSVDSLKTKTNYELLFVKKIKSLLRLTLKLLAPNM